EGAEPALAATLAAQLGRGNREVRQSLSRALAALGPAADDALAQAAEHGDAESRTHAVATQRLVDDPDEGFESALFEAERIVALAAAPTVTEAPGVTAAPEETATAPAPARAQRRA